jgi:DNA-binding response OmpR family regulator
VKNDEILNQLFGADLGDAKLLQIAKLTEAGLSVAAVMHEMRQPISALKIALQLLREKLPPDDEPRGYLKDALQQTARLEELVDRTREFMRTSEGTTSVALTEVVDSAVTLVRWQLERHRIGLELDVEDGLSPIMGDRNHLEQMLINLLSNARDAVMAAGGQGRVLVSLRRAGEEGIAIVVADSGSGIEPDVAERIFQPFFTTKPAEKGTGLGLFIVQRVAAAHGADVDLLSRTELKELGKGSAFKTGFRVQFPDRFSRETKRPTAPTEAPRREGARRALVVDDEEVILRLMGKLLEGEGFDCTSVKSGESALDALERGWFDLLVTDKNLPGISGIEVARFARNSMPWMPILIVTGFASEESAREAAALGVADYVLKPIDVEDFRARVDKVCRIGRGLGEGRPSEPPAGSELATVPPPDPERATTPPGARESQRRVSAAPARRSSAPPANRRTSAPPSASRSGKLSSPPQLGEAGKSGVTRGGAASSSGRDSSAPSKPAPRLRPEEIDIRVAVLLVEPDEEVRGEVGGAIGALGCEVASFGSVEEARIHATKAGFEVLVANRDILAEERAWFMEVGGKRVLGAIAIMDRPGVDKAIEAIHLGARGVLSPPFEASRVVFEFKRSVGRLIAEKR